MRQIQNVYFSSVFVDNSFALLVLLAEPRLHTYILNFGLMLLVYFFWPCAQNDSKRKASVAFYVKVNISLVLTIVSK